MSWNDIGECDEVFISDLIPAFHLRHPLGFALPYAFWVDVERSVQTQPVQPVQLVQLVQLAQHVLKRKNLRENQKAAGKRCRRKRKWSAELEEIELKQL